MLQTEVVEKRRTEIAFTVFFFVMLLMI